MAIGSVLPWPAPVEGESLWTRWTAGWAHQAAFGSARGALAALLAARGVQRVWLPAYLCPALLQACAGRQVCWYGVDATLRPSPPTGLRDGDAVVAIAYFGRTDSCWPALAKAKPGVLWVEDRAQAMHPGPAWGSAILYSPRKLVGVGDGGLLLAATPLPVPGPPAGRQAAAQQARARDEEGQHPADWFPLFQAQEAAFGPDDSCMEPQTRHALRHVPAAPAIAARRSNAALLTRALADLALWPEADWAALGVPVRVGDAGAVAARLAAAGIWCARHWAVLPSDARLFPAAHRLAGELLTLPCDERYGPAEMETVAAAVRTALR